MTGYSQTQQQYIRCLCMLLALICAFSSPLPHMHECSGEQCSVCVFLSTWKYLWLPTLVSAAIAITSVHLLKPVIDINSYSDDSLVELKVKLSD